MFLPGVPPDEKARKAEAVSERIATGDRAMVTAFWPREVLNGLLMGERCKRLYDAAYLELAMREKQALATVDEDLAEAAQAEGITLL